MAEEAKVVALCICTECVLRLQGVSDGLIEKILKMIAEEEKAKPKDSGMPGVKVEHDEGIKNNAAVIATSGLTDALKVPEVEFVIPVEEFSQIQSWSYTLRQLLIRWRTSMGNRFDPGETLSIPQFPGIVFELKKASKGGVNRLRMGMTVLTGDLAPNRVQLMSDAQTWNLHR
jgi:hypothetical protein